MQNRYIPTSHATRHDFPPGVYKVEFNPQDSTFTVVEGAQKGQKIYCTCSSCTVTVFDVIESFESESDNE